MRTSGQAWKRKLRFVTLSKAISTIKSPMIFRILGSAFSGVVLIFFTCSDDKLDHAFKKYTGGFRFSVHSEAFHSYDIQPYSVQDYTADGSVVVDWPAGRSLCNYDQNGGNDRLIITWDNMFVPIHLNKDGTFKRSTCNVVGEFVSEDQVEFQVTQASRDYRDTYKITGNRK